MTRTTADLSPVRFPDLSTVLPTVLQRGTP